MPNRTCIFKNGTNYRTVNTQNSRGFAGEGASNESGVVETGDFRFIRSLSCEHFTYMATQQLSGDTTVNDFVHISRSLDCFTKFLKNGV